MVLEEEVKISEVSEPSILPYTQNQTLESLGKLSFPMSGNNTFEKSDFTDPRFSF